MMRSPKRRRSTLLDRVLALAFLGFFVYLIHLAMSGRADDLVRELANGLARMFG